jgi:hypothetical protein
MGGSRCPYTTPLSNDTRMPIFSVLLKPHSLPR